MRKALQSRGLNDPGPGTRYFNDQAFAARMQIYSGIAFEGSQSAATKFFGDAPNRVLNKVAITPS